MEVDWYEVLGCSINSSRAEIEKAVRKLSLKYHSDKTDDPDAPAKFLQIQKAKEILLDDTKRKEIDDVIRAKLKRKENESKKVQEMSENRKKMKEKLEQNLRQASASTTAVPSSSTQTNTSNHLSEKEKLDKIRRESAQKMEDMAREAQETKMRKEKLSQEYSHNLQSGSSSTYADEFSNQIKIKWRRSRESHSEESLYQLLKVHGSIEDTRLGDKGTSATVTFTDAASAQSCVEAYALSEEYRVSLIVKEKPKVKPSVFTYDYSAKEREQRSAMGGSTHTNHMSGQSISSQFPNSAVLSSESELLAMMRRAVEKEKLLRSLPPEYVNRATQDQTSYSDVPTGTYQHEHAEGSIDTKSADINKPPILPVGMKSALNGSASSSLMNQESDILARMKKRKQELAQKSDT